MLAYFGKLSHISSFIQTRPVAVEFLDVEQQKDRRNEADSSFLQLLFEQV
jgi:hypothetical protein